MALEIVVAPTAKRDLEEIFDFIAVDDAGAAARMLHRIESTALRLAEFPFLGSSFIYFPRLKLRKMSVPPYVIFYRRQADELQIVRVLHSSRDLGNPEL